MALPEYPYIDLEDYFMLDNTVKSGRYEYIDGTLRMLAGGTPNHAIIAGNVITQLTTALEDSPCIVYTSDVRVQFSATRYVHPDVTVGCDPRDSTNEHGIAYPRIIVEVLSPGTEMIDRGEKLTMYLNCPTLQAYLLVGSQRQSVEVYQREGNKWTLTVYGAGDLIHLDVIDVDIAFDAIYKKTTVQ